MIPEEYLKDLKINADMQPRKKDENILLIQRAYHVVILNTKRNILFVLCAVQ